MKSIHLISIDFDVKKVIKALEVLETCTTTTAALMGSSIGSKPTLLLKSRVESTTTS